MTGDIVRLGDESGNSSHISVEQLLEGSLEELKEGKIVANRAIIIFLDDESQEDIFHAVSRHAQMRYSRCVSLLEVVKTSFVRMILEGDNV